MRDLQGPATNNFFILCMSPVLNGTGTKHLSTVHLKFRFNWAFELFFPLNQAPLDLDWDAPASYNVLALPDPQKLQEHKYLLFSAPALVEELPMHGVCCGTWQECESQPRTPGLPRPGRGKHPQAEKHSSVSPTSVFIWISWWSCQNVSFDLVGLDWGLRSCFPHKLPGGADAAGSQRTPEGAWWQDLPLSMGPGGGRRDALGEVDLLPNFSSWT